HQVVIACDFSRFGRRRPVVRCRHVVGVVLSVPLFGHGGTSSLGIRSRGRCRRVIRRLIITRWRHRDGKEDRWPPCYLTLVVVCRGGIGTGAAGARAGVPSGPLKSALS